MAKKDLEMIISSCDSYKDLWDPNLYFLNKNWSDRFFEVTLLTDKVTDFSFDKIKIVACENEIDITKRIKKALDESSAEYIFLTLDDYFFTKKINSYAIYKLFTIAKENNIDYLRLFNTPREKKPFDKKSSLFYIDLTRNYAVNLYPGIWKKDFLYMTLFGESNIWDYEVSLTKKAITNNCLCVAYLGNELPFLDVVRKGKILHKAKKVLKKNGFFLDRRVVPIQEEIKLSIMKSCKAILPRFMQRFIKRILLRMGFKFISKDI